MNKLKKNNIALLLLIQFHLIGLVGISLESWRELVLDLTPMNLVLTGGVLIWSFPNKVKWIKLGVILFLIGYWIEVIGVKTGVLFGEYKYGTNLGAKVLGVPLTIGLNWTVLAIASAGFMSIVNSAGKWAKIFFSAFLMVGLDVLIEPLCAELDYWYWTDGSAPVLNFIMWFLVAVTMQWIIHREKQLYNPVVSIGVLAVQFGFFAVLNLVI